MKKLFSLSLISLLISSLFAFEENSSFTLKDLDSFTSSYFDSYITIKEKDAPKDEKEEVLDLWEEENKDGNFYKEKFL